jgi:hypothetical protein
MINTASLYHRDGAACTDAWSCAQADHTSIPPRCGGPAPARLDRCDLAAGHPGPHLHVWPS